MVWNGYDWAEDEPTRWSDAEDDEDKDVLPSLPSSWEVDTAEETAVEEMEVGSRVEETAAAATGAAVKAVVARAVAAPGVVMVGAAVVS